MIVPMAIAMVAAVPFAMKEPPREPGSPRFDLAGAVLFGVGVAAFLYSLTQASVAGWTSPIVLGSQAVAVACGVLFVRVENRVESPMIDLRMFRSRTFTAGNLEAPFANELLLKTGNLFANLGTNRLTLSFAPSSGLFSGSVLVPGGTRTLLFKGALHHKGAYGEGFFPGTTEGGRVTLGPRP